jgi:hypothetical protein
MINQEDEDQYLQDPTNRDLPLDVELRVGNIDEIPDDLYDYLLDQFIAKAQDMGYDVVETDNLVLGEWTIRARLTEV